MVTINELAQIVIDASGKRDTGFRHIDGPQGVRGHNSHNSRIHDVLGWEPAKQLAEGIVPTYRWIDKMVAEG